MADSSDYKPSKFEKVKEGYPDLFGDLDIDVVGGVTGRAYKGHMRLRLAPTASNIADHDRIFRQILANPTPGEQVSDDAALVAEAVAFFRTRVVSAPPWFIDCNYGHTLVDVNVLGHLYARAEALVDRRERDAKKCDKGVQATLRKYLEEERKKLVEEGGDVTGIKKPDGTADDDTGEDDENKDE